MLFNVGNGGTYMFYRKLPTHQYQFVWVLGALSVSVFYNQDLFAALPAYQNNRPSVATTAPAVNTVASPTPSPTPSPTATLMTPMGFATTPQFNIVTPTSHRNTGSTRAESFKRCKGLVGTNRTRCMSGQSVLIASQANEHGVASVGGFRAIQEVSGNGGSYLSIPASVCNGGSPSLNSSGLICMVADEVGAYCSKIAGRTPAEPEAHCNFSDEQHCSDKVAFVPPPGPASGSQPPKACTWNAAALGSYSERGAPAVRKNGANLEAKCTDTGSSRQKVSGQVLCQ